MHTLVSELLELKGRQIYAVRPTDSVYEAIRQMSEHGVGALLVMEGDALRGILSERDYARKIVLEGKSSKNTTVSEIMTSNLHIATPASTVGQCMRLMTEKRIRHLPVVAAGKVEGVLSIGDLVKKIINDQRVEIEQLQSYIAGQT